MGRIAILDESTVGQIAAGEVIERPVSVVKELIENSLDAGATRIEVACEEGGRGALRVDDDGWGMDRDDAVLALQPHATSKLRDAHDLPRIATFGFRGEALASIAAVSAIELITRPRAADSGVRLCARGGVITDLQEVGAPAGTSITVRDLFFNAPVRRRYLRAPSTELSHLGDCVGQCLVAHPEVAFRLTHAGETLLHHGGGGLRRDAVAAVFGAEAARQLVAVEVAGAQCAATGFISPPAFTRGTRGWQWLFVNGRPIRSKVLTHAIDQAYHTLLPGGRFPVVILLLRLDPALVDVNVHPAKSEVRFLLEGELHRFVARALREALDAADLTPRMGAPPPASGPPPGERSPAAAAPAAAVGAPASALPLPFDPTPTAPAPPEVRAQIHNTFILAEGPEGLFIIDQHTAHERRLFEQIMSGGGDLLRPQPLAVPFVLSLAAREAAALRAHLDALQASGFLLEAFGHDAFLVRSVPAALEGAPCEAVLRDIVEELLQNQVSPTLEARREKLASLLACRGAVKAGDRLTLPEMQAIVRGLYQLQTRATCQHGRPTVILLSREELERRFHR